MILRRFYIAQMLDCDYAAKPFRVIEKVRTVDGPRDRITSRTFDTLEAAQAWVDAEHAKG